MNILLARAGWHGVCLTTKPPQPLAFPPKPRRLPERKRMTIALGIIASNGIVLAADTEETMGVAGYSKTDQTKILGYFSADNQRPLGACFISGAGDAGYIEALSQTLGRVFVNHPSLTERPLERQLGKEWKKFYQDH